MASVLFVAKPMTIRNSRPKMIGAIKNRRSQKCLLTASKARQCLDGHKSSNDHHCG